MKKIRVTDVVVIRREVDMVFYPGMTPDEAADFERNLDAPDMLESIVSQLEVEEPLVFERVVTVIEVEDQTQPVEGQDPLASTAEQLFAVASPELARELEEEPDKHAVKLQPTGDTIIGRPSQDVQVHFDRDERKQAPAGYQIGGRHETDRIISRNN